MVVEKFGIDRLVENLECHMWPNMVIRLFQFEEQSKKYQHKADDKPKKEKDVTEDKKEKTETTQDSNNSPSKEKGGEFKESNSAKKAADMLAEQLFKDLEDDDEKEMDELANIFHSIQNFRNTYSLIFL